MELWSFSDVSMAGTDRPMLSHPLRFGPFRLDGREGLLWRRNRVVPLPPKATAVLWCLASQAGQLVTKAALLEAGWGETVVSEEVLTGCIRALRRALGDDPKRRRYIETVHRRGYRFVASLPDPATLRGSDESLPEERFRDDAIAPPVERPERTPGRPSIAVLPFAVEGDDSGREYFGEGVVEDIIGSLASLGELSVISRSSTLRYRGGGADTRMVGRDLGVGYVLSGNIRQANNRLRIGVELAESRRGTVVWARHFDGMSRDLFALQDEIVNKAVATLAPQVREAELRWALRQRPESMEAYDCFLRGATQRYHLGAEDFAEAGVFLRRAIELDPGYAAPYAVLADWYSIRMYQGRSPDIQADRAEAGRLATAALERDSFDATALAICGHLKSFLFQDFDEAIALFDRALAASPSSALAWTRSSATYSYLGLADQAVARAEEGLRLSPLDPHLFFTHGSLSLAHYAGGHYLDAVRWGQKAMDANPRFVANVRILAASMAAANQLAEAQAVGRALLMLAPTFRVSTFMEGYALRDSERRALLATHLRLAGLPD
jgi:adenylate cyclase